MSEGLEATLALEIARYFDRHLREELEKRPDLLAVRRFPWRHALAPWVERAYHARIPTRAVARCRAHALRYAA